MGKPIQRVPIKIQRTSVKLPHDIKCQLRLRELQDGRKHKEVIGMIKHYDMLARRWKNTTGYKSVDLSLGEIDPNWQFFDFLWEICREKEWDPLLYLDVQFKHAKRLPKGIMPKPNHIYTTDKLIIMTNYLSDVRTKHEHDTNKAQKERGSKTMGIREEVIEEIISSVEQLADYISRTRFDNLEEYKVLRIHEFWQTFSPFYLWSIPWFHEILPDLEGKKAQEYKEDFNTISRSHSLQRLIAETVQKVEKHYNIPGNLSL